MATVVEKENKYFQDYNKKRIMANTQFSKEIWNRCVFCGQPYPDELGEFVFSHFSMRLKYITTYRDIPYHLSCRHRFEQTNTLISQGLIISISLFSFFSVWQESLLRAIGAASIIGFFTWMFIEGFINPGHVRFLIIKFRRGF